MAAGSLGFLIGFLTLLHLTVCVSTSPPCVTRRCLSQKLIDQDILSQPQTENCTVDVFLKHIIYQTVDVNTKKLLFTSTLKVQMIWEDPVLAWNMSEYPHDQVMLPAKKVWTPHLSVKNAVSSTLEHDSKDLLVFSNGTVVHQVLMSIVVGCDINLYSYPFTTDSCPVYLDGRNSMGCGSIINIGKIYPKGIERGDWRTDSVGDIRDKKGYTYLWVTLSTRSFNPMVTLILPSILIMLADVASFSLPLGGGERNSFKVTLVLSFIMFLIILSDILPGDSLCSPLIRYHFCVCLICLVISMILSMLLTRLGDDGSFVPFSLPRWCSQRDKPSHAEDSPNAADSEPEAPGTGTDPKAEDAALQRVAEYLEGVTAQDRLAHSRKTLANKLDKICFWIYVLFYIVYAMVMAYMSNYYMCAVDNLEF
ncbi:5-hydroxytryptamine receptor 3A-like [Anguilla rostrata]|uniref:5-hydroxytryptamine receptor 3A-like n=1 Tax=Anguilla rostrata TaxID=7938 RepID=UPI0030D2F291